MKLSTIAKTSLALGILTTGVMTTYAQSADANSSINNGGINILSVEEKNKLQGLERYYSQKGHELHKQTGHKTGDRVSVVDTVSKQYTEIKLAGKDKVDLREGELKDIDVFVVREDLNRGAENYSIGGITDSNKNQYYDYVNDPYITVNTHNSGTISSKSLGRFEINKEKISLKELDFKLRQKLMKETGLYKTNNKTGKIVIKMKERGIQNDYYTFDLNKKLEEERMGDVVDTKYIDRIDVEYK